MHYSTILMLLLPASFALPHISRSQDLAPQVLTTITDLNAAVTALTTAVNGFNGSLLGILPETLAVVGAETKLDATILKVTAITSQSSNFTAAESSQVVQSLASQISPIQASLEALKTKYPVFKKTIIEAPIVLLDLKVLKKHTDGFITAVTAKATEDQAGLLGLGALILDQAFDDAIAVYQG